LFGSKRLVINQGIENCLWEFHKSSEEYPIVQYSEQNCIILNNPKTGFISMTYFAKVPKTLAQGLW